MEDIKVPIYYMIILWWVSMVVFAYAFLTISPLKLTFKNYGFCYAILIAITGLFADCIVVANKPLKPKEEILKRFPDEWNTKIPISDTVNLGKMCNDVWSLYSLGNTNYQNSHNWTWNYELPHVMGNTIYLLALVFLFLENRSAFITSLLFGSIMLMIDYVTYVIHVIYEVVNGTHSDTKLLNMIISWGTLDLPYMFFASAFIFWYAYTSLQ